MGHVMRLLNGTCETIFSPDDFEDVLDKYLGMEAADYFHTLFTRCDESYQEDTTALQEEIDELKQEKADMEETIEELESKVEDLEFEIEDRKDKYKDLEEEFEEYRYEHR